MKRRAARGARGGRRTRRAFLAALAGAVFAAASWLGLRWWKSQRPAKGNRPGAEPPARGEVSRGDLYEPHDLAG